MAASVRDTSAWLVATKLHAPLTRSDTISRPHLEQALSQSVQTLPLTLLSAPAGYGKTTMLASLKRLLPHLPLAWITLDSEDNDPMRFLSLLIAALQRLHPQCGSAVWPWLSGSAESSNVKRAVGALINDILEYLPEPFVLVLDDLHFVTEPVVYVALEYLLDHHPPQLHLAVGTRHDPPLRLARLAARRQMAELRQPDLSFNRDEAHLLLNETLSLQLSEEEVVVLQQRTEGWPAGLCLLAGPLGHMVTSADRMQFMAALTHTERYALDFFAEEVLRYLPNDVRLFLLQTSILLEMTPSVCEAVTGRTDAAEVLDGLYRQNLTIATIVPEAENEPVFRHHALFARLLARQLEKELPGQIKELHHRAALVQKTPGRAIYHYVSAGLWDKAAQLMIHSGMQLLHNGMAETVRIWYNALPATTKVEYPILSVLMGRCEIHHGDYTAAELLLRQANEAFVTTGDEQGEGDALTSLVTIAYQNDDKPAAATYVKRLFQLLLSPMGQVAAHLARAWLYISESNWTASYADIREALSIPQATGDRRADLIGITYMSAPLAAVPGCLELTAQYCTEASALAPSDTAWRLGAHELGVWPLLWWGRTEEAFARAEAAENLRQRLGGYPFVGNDLPIQLALLHFAQGNLQAAELATDTLVQRIEAAPHGKWAFYMHAAGKALAMLGRLAEAEAMSRRLAALPETSRFRQYLRDHLAGLLAIQQGNGPEAETMLSRAIQLEVELPIAWVGGSARMLQARLNYDQGCTEAALSMAATVTQQWEGAGTPGCALLDGLVTLPVIQLAAQNGVTSARQVLRFFGEKAFAVVNQTFGSCDVAGEGEATAPAPAIQLKAPVSTNPSGIGSSESLTQRECEVLKLLVAGNTNRQIAEALSVTQETVKSHVVHILRKLNVTSRTQAAVRGRELGF